MSDRPHPVLVSIAALVYLFLMAPLVIVVGAAHSDTPYLTFPPQGLSLRWFENIFAISAFRRTILTSFQIAFLATLLALLIGIPAAYALNRYRIQLPSWLGTLFVLPILVPEIVFGFALLKSVAVGAGAPIYPALPLGPPGLGLSLLGPGLRAGPRTGEGRGGEGGRVRGVAD